MRLLLDTQVVLWSASEPDRLLPGARSAIEEAANDVLVSVVTAWEIAIKQSLGKLEIPRPAEEWLPAMLHRTGFDVAELGSWQRCE